MRTGNQQDRETWKAKLRLKVFLASILSLVLFLGTVYSVRADEVKYIYDDLGRLYQVIDAQGDVATYNYDAVGNLLSITRSTGGIPAPEITSITPDNARAGDTVNVTLSGNGLMGAGVATDNPGLAVSDVRTSDTLITAAFTLSFFARQGPTTVTVTTSLGSFGIGFTVHHPPPTINALDPASGPPTRLVKILGTGFHLTPSENQVRFNGVAATVYSSTPFKILTSVPAGATTGLVTVTTNGGTSNGIAFTVTAAAGPPPTISAITPNVGSVEGGSSITITGSGFTADTAVYIGGDEVPSVALIDESSLKVTTPASIAGPADVLLTNSNGDAFLPGGFTYLTGPPERVADINPTMGLTGIPINTDITVLFSRPVDRTTVNSTSISLVETSLATPVSGIFSFDFDDAAAIFTPSANLKPNISYTLYITRNIRSADGIPLDLPFSGSFTTAGSADTTAPNVTVSPGNGATGVPVNSQIVFGFSESMNPATINASTITVTDNGTAVTGGVTLGQQNTVATFTPYLAFSPNSPVTVTLSARVTDTAGNAIVGSGGPGTNLVSTFTTATTSDMVAPRVLNINPPDKAAGINLYTTVSASFSEPVNPVTVNTDTFTLSSEGIDYPGQISFSNQDAVATFIPDQPLPTMTLITATLDAGIADTAGNAMPTPFTSSFTTQTSQDNYQPSVIEVSPYNGQSGVSLNSDITIVFDERVNPISVTGSSFYARTYVSGVGYVMVSGKLSVSGDGLMATLSPSQPLLPNTTHTIYYTNGITDVAGNPLYNPGNRSFTTGVEPADNTPPQVVEASPANGAAGVPLNGIVRVEFSEAVDQTTVDNSTVVISTGGVPLVGDLSFEQDGRVVRYQVADLYTFEPNTFYEVRVTPGVTDTSGNPLAAEFTSGFTTAVGSDTTAPVVASVLPANGTPDVSINPVIEVNFDEPIDPVAVYSGTFWLAMDYYWGSAVAGTYTISADRLKVTFRPDYPLFAGHRYYIRVENIEDRAGNRLARCYSCYSFITAYAPGTDPNILPNAAAAVANPNKLYADGNTTTTIEISNINRNGVLVPNGTKIAVTADPTTFYGYAGSAGGTIQGGVVSSSDPRFQVFTTVGGKVTLTYRSANLPELTPGATQTASIQVASVDEAETPVSLIGVASVTLFRGKNATVSANPASLLADGSSYSEVEIRVSDPYSLPVPAGMRIGVTVETVYFGNSLGGTIQGGVIAPDSRFKLFTTITGGIVVLNYTAPALAASQDGSAWIQVVEVDNLDRVIGLIGFRQISLDGSTGYSAPQPRVLSVSPVYGQSGVGLNAPVTAEFSQPLDPATVTSSNFSIRQYGGPWSYISGTLTLQDGLYGVNTVATFIPDNPWAPNTSYNVYIGTGITSISGNPLFQYSSTSFSTGTSVDDQAPSVVRVNPPDGVTGVAINSVVSVEFSEPMNPATVNPSSFRLSDGTGGISGRVVADSATVYRFIPDALLTPDTSYTVTVASTVTDTAGNPMAAAFTASFTTQLGQDNVQPNVESVSPANGSTGVSVNTAGVITFSEPMNPLTLNSNYCYLVYGSYYGPKVPSTVTLSNNNTVATLTPTQPLFAGSFYYVWVTTNVTDIAGNSLPSQFNSSFTTAMAPGTTDLPNGAAITINPRSLFANGQIATTVIISNINRNGTPVPNGTLIGITAEPAFNQSFVGGIISGNSVGTSPDSRFLLFSTEGASVTISYTPPDLDWLGPGATASGVIQVAAVDLDNRPVSLIAQGTTTLFRVKTATMTADPTTLPADGTSQSAVEVIVKDNLGNLVPDGTEVGITAEPIFVGSTAGGTIIGGATSSGDSRVQVFTTAGGRFSFSYQAPSDRGPGYGTIQAVAVDRGGYPTGLISTTNITLNNL